METTTRQGRAQAASALMEPRLLTYEQARERVLADASPSAHETVPLARARFRALARRIVAPHALPPFRNSAMDGYAVRVADLAGATPSSPVTLRVVEVLPAGRAPTLTLRAGEAARIMTGAPLPEAADGVVPFEEAERQGEGAVEHGLFRHPAARGANVRDAGADVAEGEAVLEQGRELSPHDLALLAALGFAEVPVGAAPRVAVLSTGDELLDPGDALQPGTIRDSNLPMLALLCEQAGAQVVVAERLPDDPARVAARVMEVIAIADVVLTIGGVSAGDYDPVKLALSQLGEIELWRVAMRPGRPQAHGTPQGKFFHGLPGNPASVACVFEALVRPALRNMQGFSSLDRPRAPVRVAAAIESKAGRTDFVRCTLEWRGRELWATPAGSQVSGHLAPQARAHALVIVPAAAEQLAANAEAEALVLRLPEMPGR